MAPARAVTPAQAREPLVVLDGVTKRFGGATALADVSLTIEAGRVHCLVGENGAGKSTLGKIIAGVHRADGGRMLLRGRPADFRSPRESIAAGVAFIAQELAIVPDRTVLENVFLGRMGLAAGLVPKRRLLRDYAELTERIGFELPPDTRAGSLRLADRQKVEILRALARDAELIIMDEPTASLTGADTEQLLRVIADLRAAGRTVVFVTHFLGDALAVADRVTVLKDGRVVRTGPAAEETGESLVEAMLGRSLGAMFPERDDGAAGDDVILRVDGLSRGAEFSDVSLSVRRGEIVGIAGLVGSGRTELLETLVGLRKPDRGTVAVAAAQGPFGSPRKAQRAGLVLVPESRKEHGLVMGRTVRENVALAHLGAVNRLGFVSRKRQDELVRAVLPKVGLDAARIDSPVRELSGGNQQKVMFARWLCTRPAVLLADEPTRGVDVGARSSLYRLIRTVAGEGSGVLVVSSDNEEVIGLADRVLVMRAGRIVGELAGDAITEHAVLELMFDEGEREAAS